MPLESTDLNQRLIRYGVAIGAGGLMSQNVLADGTAFDPPGGLPITIDNTTTDLAPLSIDLNGDMQEDYQIYYHTKYGGGFAIISNNAVVFNRVQLSYTDLCNNTPRTLRNEPTEYISPDNNSNFYADFRATSEPSYICLLYTSPSPRDQRGSRMPSSA